MKNRYKYKKYIINSILLLGIVQLVRMFLNWILIGQLTDNYINVNITSIVSFTLVGISIFMILKNYKIYNVFNEKIIILFSRKNSLLRYISTSIVIATTLIALYQEGWYVADNIVVMMLYVIIIPIFEEVLLREYIWNYLKHNLRNDKLVFVIMTVISGLYNIGYIDIVVREANLSYNSNYITEILLFKIITGIITGISSGIVKLKFKDTYLCVLIHSLINIFSR